MDLLPPVAIPKDPVPQPSIASESPTQGSSFKAVLAELASRMDRGEASVNAVTDAAHGLGPEVNF